MRPRFDTTIIDLSIPENAAVGITVGTPISGSDADRGDILTYVLTNDPDETGDDAPFFKINKMTGQITLARMLDAERDAGEGADSYQVIVTAYDPSNVASLIPAEVTVTATDVNEAPEVTVTGEMTAVDENHEVVPDPVDGEAVPPLGTYDADDDRSRRRRHYS